MVHSAKKRHSEHEDFLLPAGIRIILREMKILKDDKELKMCINQAGPNVFTKYLHIFDTVSKP